MDWPTDNYAESFKILLKIAAVFHSKENLRQNRLYAFFSRWGKRDSSADNSWAVHGAQQTPAAILDRFREQLEPAENFPIARLKLMAYH